MGLEGPMGLEGLEGPVGPEGPPGVVDSYNVNVEDDQGMIGTAISGVYGQTPIPATLTVNAEPGTYLLTWNAEVMRTIQGGGATFFVRLRDTTSASTLGFLRAGSGVTNGAVANIPEDDEFFVAGSLIPFSGSAVLTLPAGPQTYRLEYAVSSSATSLVALRAQHQRIALMRLE